MGVLTLDVEDWEHANFAQLKGQSLVIAESFREKKYAMDANTDLWLEILSTTGAKSTCFVLGEFANRYPNAIKKIAQAGHEIASHGATHDLIYDMTQEQFREFLNKALSELGTLTGKKPLGFRAPSWSVSRLKTPWFCEELERQSLRYDSSEFPMRTPLFGEKNAPLKPYFEGKIFRIPVTVLALGSLRIPFASGAFFRLAPLPMIQYGLSRAQSLGLPVMLVLHPRELDPGHPRLPLKGWEKWIHYANLSSTVPKLKKLLKEYKWSSIAEAYRQDLQT